MLIHEIPLYTIFVFILIVSANFLAQLFPCRFQKALSDNMYIKHVFGLLTLNFFVTLTLPEYNASLYETFKSSSLLYLLFIVITNIETTFFYIVLFLSGISYLIYLKKNVLQTKINEIAETPDTVDNARAKGLSTETGPMLKDQLNTYHTIAHYINIMSMALIAFGFIVYLGKKKYEYKNDFRFLTFLFGRPTCLDKSPSISYMQAIKYAFT